MAAPDSQNLKAKSLPRLAAIAALCVISASLCAPAEGAATFVVEQPDGNPLDVRYHEWGENAFGPESLQKPRPDDLGDAVATAPGYYHSMALRRSGRVEAWGGVGDVNYSVPEGFGKVVAIARGFEHVLGLTDAGRVVVWGNRVGQGRAFYADGTAGVASIAAGFRASVMLMNDGRVIVYSDDAVIETVPPNLSGVISLSTSGYHGLALRADGTVMAWGANERNQARVPAGLSQVTAVAAGATHSVALRADGSVVAWGDSRKLALAIPPDLGVVTAIAAGEFFTLALLADGTVRTWGDRIKARTDVPPDLSGVVSIGAGVLQASALQRMADCGQAAVGRATVARPLRLKNAGESPARVRAISILGEHAGEFSLMPPDLTGTLVEPGGFLGIEVACTPQSSGERRAYLRVESDIPGAPRYDVLLTGEGIGPSLTVRGVDTEISAGSISPSVASSTDFGEAGVGGAPVIRSYELLNDGTAPLALLGSHSVVIDGEAASDFKVAAAPASSVIQVQESLFFRIAFVPSADGPRMATVRIKSDDPAYPDFEYTIRGLGRHVPRLVVDTPTTPPGSGRLRIWGLVRQGFNPVVDFTPPRNLGDVAAVELGNDHVLVLKDDGTVAAWGDNQLGQIALPPGLEGVVDIAAGGDHSLALKSDGTVVAWGRNTPNGQATVPVGLDRVRAVGAGGNFSGVVQSNGMPVVWGGEELPPWGIFPAWLPGGLGEVTELDSGAGAVLVLGADGMLWSVSPAADRGLPLPRIPRIVGVWGTQGQALVQREDGSLFLWVPPRQAGQESLSAEAPDAIDHAVAASLSQTHSLAVNPGGRVAVWGQGVNPPEVLTPPPDLATVTAVQAGRSVSFAIERHQSHGSLFQGSVGPPLVYSLRNESQVPVEVQSVEVTGSHPTDFIVDAGQVVGVPLGPGETADFEVAFAPTGLGDRQALLRVRSTDFLRPVQDIAMTGEALSSRVEVFARGTRVADGESSPTPANDFGRATIGKGTTERTFTVFNTGNIDLVFTGSPLIAIEGEAASDFEVLDPWPVGPVVPGAHVDIRIRFTPSGEGVRSAWLGIPTNAFRNSFFRCVLTGWGDPGPALEIEVAGRLPEEEGYRVYGWGRKSEAGTLPANLGRIVSIASGERHSVALRADGTVVVWGGNNAGQLQVPPGLDQVTAISAGPSYSVALRRNGTVVAWGDDSAGQCRVPSWLTAVAAVSAGREHSLAALKNGQVVAWGGYNWFRETSVPAGLSDVEGVAAGGAHSVALKSSGEIASWGNTLAGAAGFDGGGTAYSAVAAGLDFSFGLTRSGGISLWGRRVASAPMAGVRSFAVGGAHVLYLDRDGSVVASGDDYYSQSTVPAGLPAASAVRAGWAQSYALVRSVEMGRAEVGQPAVAQEIVIRNKGNVPLNISNVLLVGEHADDFAVTGSRLIGEVGQGEERTALISLIPGAPGERQAVFRVVSNDAEQGTYDLVVVGRGVAVNLTHQAYREWARLAGLAGGDAEPEAAPYGDAIPNLLKFAFNMDGGRADASELIPGVGARGLPVAVLAGDGQASALRVEFIRRRNMDLRYIVYAGPELDSQSPVLAVPVVTQIDDAFERVVVEVPLGSPAAPSQYCSIAVSLPEI